jgi:hypothetical protein
MAGHAGGHRRYAGEGLLLHAAVAIPAIEADLAHVMLVTERNRLFHGLVFTVRFAGGASPHRDADDGGHQQHEPCQLCVETRAWVEYLCHLPRRSFLTP